MLVICGAADNVSVVMRHTLVQLLTPDDKRGRVSAVNSLFIGTSNELGGFESGMVAHWLGPGALGRDRRRGNDSRRDRRGVDLAGGAPPRSAHGGVNWAGLLYFGARFATSW